MCIQLTLLPPSQPPNLVLTHLIILHRSIRDRVDHGLSEVRPTNVQCLADQFLRQLV